MARSAEDLERGVAALGGYAQGLYVERWAPFVKEVAVMVVRSRWVGGGCAGAPPPQGAPLAHVPVRGRSPLQCRMPGVLPVSGTHA